ncbi:MAG: exosortase/archaeosortase family protein [Halobacteriota archaeon]
MISVLFLCLLYLNTLHWLVYSWIHNPYYSHGFIVLAISGYFAYRQRGMEFNINNSGLYVVTPSVLVHVFSSLWSVEYLSALSFITALFGLCWTFYGDQARDILFPVFFLVLAVPLPIYGITNQLEVLSAGASAGLVNLLGIEATHIGAEIHLSASSFVVGTPCSGIRSIMALLTIAALYAYLINDRMWLKGLLVAIAVPIAFVANILRITSILTIAEFFNTEIALGFFHYASDIMLFVLGVIMLMVFRRCVSCLTSGPHSS